MSHDSKLTGSGKSARAFLSPSEASNSSSLIVQLNVLIGNFYMLNVQYIEYVIFYVIVLLASLMQRRDVLKTASVLRTLFR